MPFLAILAFLVKMDFFGDFGQNGRFGRFGRFWKKGPKIRGFRGPFWQKSQNWPFYSFCSFLSKVAIFVIFVIFVKMSIFALFDVFCILGHFLVRFDKNGRFGHFWKKALQIRGIRGPFCRKWQFWPFWAFWPQFWGPWNVQIWGYPQNAHFGGLLKSDHFGHSQNAPSTIWVSPNFRGRDLVFGGPVRKSQYRETTLGHPLRNRPARECFY